MGKKTDKKDGPKAKKKKFDAKKFKVDEGEASTSADQAPGQDEKDTKKETKEEDVSKTENNNKAGDKKETDSDASASSEKASAKKDEKAAKKKSKKGDEDGEDQKKDKKEKKNKEEDMETDKKDKKKNKEDKKKDKKEKKKMEEDKKKEEVSSASPKEKITEEVLEEFLSIGKQLQTMNIALTKQFDELMQQEEAMEELEEPMTRIQRYTGGTYQMLWRIPSFTSKYDEARDGTKSIIYSPNFRTHNDGYNMALSLCPYGDGKAAGQAMSLFFCLLKCKEDALHSWPFAHPITFSLLDQKETPPPSRNFHGIKRNNITHYFKPNPVLENMPFLGRPKSARNPALGIPIFVPFDKMREGEYVKDDTIYIKVDVHLDKICEAKQH